MPVLLYDGHCRLCRREARRLARIAGDSLTLQSFQDPGVLDLYPGLTREACLREVKLVHEDGRVAGGAAAVAGALALNPRWRWLGTLLRAPGLGRLAAAGYGLVARSRYRLLGAAPRDGVCGLHGATGEALAAHGAGDYRPTVGLFLRGLGLVYLIVFASLAVQIHLLIGSEGLLPVREFLAAQAGGGPGRLWRLPTLFWLWDGDMAVRGGTVLGLALALGLMLGWRTRWCLLGLWLLFLSYATAGRDFFWFQWDSLLLETSVLALLLPGRPGQPPHPWVVFLFRWLLFRLLFESGLAKVQGGAQSWYPLMAMAWYYETAPLPSLGSWYAHQLPLWIHRWSATLTLLGELVAPLLIWGPRPARRAAAALFVAFQVGIQATANYGSFNILAALLTVFLLDGRDLRWLPGWLGAGAGAAPDPGATPPWRRRAAALVAGACGAGLFLLTLLELLVLLAAPGIAASPALAGARAAVAPWRLASKYHLFAHIDPRRIEAEIEWSLDGQEWRPYHFHYKPGPLDRRPPIVAPHQPRVDFQLWFFTLGRDGGVHDYFNTLVRRLCARPDSVRALFTPESFPPRAPLAIRVAYHRYRMTDRATRQRESAYWRRELVDYHPAAYFCDATAPPRF